MNCIISPFQGLGVFCVLYFRSPHGLRCVISPFRACVMFEQYAIMAIINPEGVLFYSVGRKAYDNYINKIKAL